MSSRETARVTQPGIDTVAHFCGCGCWYEVKTHPKRAVSVYPCVGHEGGVIDAVGDAPHAYSPADVLRIASQ